MNVLRLSVATMLYGPYHPVPSPLVEVLLEPLSAERMLAMVLCRQGPTAGFYWTIQRRRDRGGIDASRPLPAWPRA